MAAAAARRVANVIPTPWRAIVTICFSMRSTLSVAVLAWHDRRALFGRRSVHEKKLPASHRRRPAVVRTDSRAGASRERRAPAAGYFEFATALPSPLEPPP